MTGCDLHYTRDLTLSLKKKFLWWRQISALNRKNLKRKSSLPHQPHLTNHDDPRWKTFHEKVITEDKQAHTFRICCGVCDFLERFQIWRNRLNCGSETGKKEMNNESHYAAYCDEWKPISCELLFSRLSAIDIKLAVQKVSFFWHSIWR